MTDKNLDTGTEPVLEDMEDKTGPAAGGAETSLPASDGENGLDVFGFPVEEPLPAIVRLSPPASDVFGFPVEVDEDDIEEEGALAESETDSKQLSPSAFDEEEETPASDETCPLFTAEDTTADVDLFYDEELDGWFGTYDNGSFGCYDPYEVPEAKTRWNGIACPEDLDEKNLLDAALSADGEPIDPFEPDPFEPDFYFEPETQPSSIWDENTKPSKVESSMVVLEEDIETAKRKLRPGNIRFWLFMALCLGVIAGCAAAGIAYYHSITQGEQELQNISEEYTEPEEDPEPEPEAEPEEEPEPVIEETVVEDQPTANVDWDGLYEVNTDVSGWINIPGTVINYPVVTGAEEQQYVHADTYGNYSENGSIFTDYENSPDYSDYHLVIYGHHMNYVTMFTEVSYMTDPAYFDQHRIVYLQTPTKEYTLRAVGVCVVDPEDYGARMVKFDSIEQFRVYAKKWIGRCEKEGYLAEEVDTENLDKLVTLITCDTTFLDSRRVLVQCVVQSERDR